MVLEHVSSSIRAQSDLESGKLDSGPSSASRELCVPGASHHFALGLGGLVQLLLSYFNHSFCS